MTQSEGDHLVQNHECPNGPGCFLHGLDKARFDGGHAHSTRHRVKQHTSASFPRCQDDSSSCFCIVERDNRNFVSQRSGRARCVGHGRWGRGRSPLARIRVQTGLGMVIGAVVAAFDFHDQGTTGECTCRLDRTHNRFGSRVAEPDLVDRHKSITQQLSEVDLDGRSQRVGRPPAELGAHCLVDHRVGMSHDDGREVVIRIEVTIAVDIGDPCAFSFGDIHRVRLDKYGRTRSAARDRVLRSSEEFG